MSEIRFTATGFRCFKDNPHHGQMVASFEPGDTWDDTAAKVAFHGAEHGCAARADEFARMKVKLSALVASMEDTVRPRPDSGLDDSMSAEFDDGAVHATAVTLRQLRAILDETATAAGQPRPAPELAAAMDAHRTTLGWFIINGTRVTADVTRAQYAGAYLDGGLLVPEELRKFLGKRKAADG